MAQTDGVTIAACQFRPGTDVRANAAAVAQWCEAAAAQGAGLVVFPEYASYCAGRLDDSVRQNAEPLDGPFVGALAEAARRSGIHVVAGMLESAAGGFVTNTLVAVGPSGEREAVYRKQHLYDAFGARESDWMRAGSTGPPEVFDVGGLRVGMQTCYDLRFPEVSRTLVDAGATVLLAPADWIPGRHKIDQWRVLTAARAVENAAYVVAPNHPEPTGVGFSRIVDPQGVVLAERGGDDEGTALAEISSAAVRETRRRNPMLESRRYQVVPVPD